MKLECLGQDFSKLNQEGQRAFFLSYSERRAFDLAKPAKRIKGQKKLGAAKKKGKNLKVSAESFALLQKLGLA